VVTVLQYLVLAACAVVALIVLYLAWMRRHPVTRLLVIGLERGMDSVDLLRLRDDPPRLLAAVEAKCRERFSLLCYRVRRFAAPIVEASYDPYLLLVRLDVLLDDEPSPAALHQLATIVRYELSIPGLSPEQRRELRDLRYEMASVVMTLTDTERIRAQLAGEPA
jgi:hypothetical protein